MPKEVPNNVSDLLEARQTAPRVGDLEEELDGLSAGQTALGVEDEAETWRANVVGRNHGEQRTREGDLSRLNLRKAWNEA